MSSYQQHFENLQQKVSHFGESVLSSVSSMGHAAHTAATREHFSSEQLMDMEGQYGAHKYVISSQLTYTQLPPPSRRVRPCARLARVGPRGQRVP